MSTNTGDAQHAEPQYARPTFHEPGASFRQVNMVSHRETGIEPSIVNDSAELETSRGDRNSSLTRRLTQRTRSDYATRVRQTMIGTPEVENENYTNFRHPGSTRCENFVN